MVEALLLVGVVAAAFVGFNIGGSSTGVAFGPAVGAGLLSKAAAGLLMAAFVTAGGWTVGRNVVETMGGDIVPQELFSLQVSVVLLVFIGGAMLVANYYGVPVSTSMTAVGSIAGLGIATGELDWATMGTIVSWWIVAPVLGFWVGAVIGRYLYPYLDEWLALEQTGGGVFALRRRGPVPLPTLGPNTTVREAVGSVLVLAIACYMGFSAGASNVANAIAPLVGSGELGMDAGVLLAAGAIGVGGLTIARRTLDTVGTDLTDLPLLAALVVATVGATITTVLSWLGIPISLALSTVMCIVGVGWGRASRVATVGEIVSRETRVELSVDALQGTEPGRDVEPIGEEDPEDLLRAGDLFDPAATARVLTIWILSPSVATLLSYLFFVAVPIAG